MHLEILNTNQKTLLEYLKLFNRSFYLVEGTAIALHIGHRRSIDFDLFTFANGLNKKLIKQKIHTIPHKKQVIFEDIDQYHIMIHDVKVTFFLYDFPIQHPFKLNNYISLPGLLDLAAMKAYALGRRTKWKDYVDLYFILKDYFSVAEISEKALFYFKDQFSEKLFRQQLAFHKDINYSEPVEYIIPPVPEDEIKAFLIDKATDVL